MDLLLEIENKIEDFFSNVPEWQLIGASVTFVLIINWLRQVIKNRKEILADILRHLYNYAKQMPFIKQRFQKELDSSRKDIIKTVFLEDEKKLECFSKIPEKGKSHEEVIVLTKQILKLGNFNWVEGKASGGVFAGKDPEFNRLMIETYSKFQLSNPLHPDVFAGATKMEAEIVAMVADMFHGTKDTVGTVTTGGTESLIMAVKTARDYGLRTRGITEPEIVTSLTAHPGIDKGCVLTGVKIIKVPINKKTCKADVADIKRAITKNTVMLIGSAPDFPYGLIDDIEELSKLCLQRNLLLHVDCCLGGFILPFMDQIGVPLPLFDFRLEGVTSISADAHKYGYCPKGVSIILYKNSDIRHSQYFTVPDWPGGVYATATLPGSRAGAHSAMCWASMVSHGKKGYQDKARKIVAVADYLKKKFSNIPGIHLNGNPAGPVVSIRSDKINIMIVCDVMATKGWHLQPLQYPPAMHIFITPLHTKVGLKEELVKDLSETVEEIIKNPPALGDGLAKMYGLAQSFPAIVKKDMVDIYQDVVYSTVDEI